VKEERNTFSKSVATLLGGYSYRPRIARNLYYHAAGLFPSQGRVDDNPQRRPAAFLIWFMNFRLSRSSATSCTNIRSTPSFILKSHSRAMHNTLRSCPTNMSNKAMLKLLYRHRKSRSPHSQFRHLTSPPLACGTGTECPELFVPPLVLTSS
jgi:hypothetical protein